MRTQASAAPPLSTAACDKHHRISTAATTVTITFTPQHSPTWLLPNPPALPIHVRHFMIHVPHPWLVVRRESLQRVIRQVRRSKPVRSVVTSRSSTSYGSGHRALPSPSFFHPPSPFSMNTPSSKLKQPNFPSLLVHDPQAGLPSATVKKRQESIKKQHRKGAETTLLTEIARGQQEPGQAPVAANARVRFDVRHGTRAPCGIAWATQCSRIVIA